MMHSGDRLGQMITFGVESSLVGNVTEREDLAIRSSPGDASVNGCGRILGAGILQLTNLHARGAVAGLVSGVCTYANTFSLI